MDLNQTEMIVYSLLYSRVSLSQKNNWIDDDGNIYVIYPIENLAKVLYKGTTVIKGALRKLKSVGLIETKRNFGASNTIYVKLPNGRNTDPQTGGKPPTNYLNIATRDSSGSRTPTAAPALQDAELAGIIQHYQAEIGEFPRSALDKLQVWREVFTVELICKAFDEAAENGVRNWKYIDGILKGWQRDGVKTLGDVERRREARKKPDKPKEKEWEVLR